MNLSSSRVLQEQHKKNFKFCRISLRLGAFLVKRSFFPKNERNNQEQSHHSKKNESLERVLKNIVTISKRTERNGMGIASKEQLKLFMRSYYQERVLSWEHILIWNVF